MPDDESRGPQLANGEPAPQEVDGDPRQDAPLPQDILTPEDPEAWKRVYFGIGSKTIWPSHPEPPEAPEDELTQAAVQDPEAEHREKDGQRSPVWPVLFILVVAIVALSIVFWKH